MLLTEQVRLLADESQLINDATTYNYQSTGWGTMKNYGNIITSKDGIVIYSYQYRLAGNASGAGYRFKIGSNYLKGNTREAFDTGWVTETGMVYLAAGTYAVVVEGIGDTGWPAYVANFVLGFVNFSDIEAQALIAYSSQISKTLTARKLATGTIKEALLFVQCFAETGTLNQTVFDDPGGSSTYGVKISVDGVGVNWTTKTIDNAPSGRRGACDATYRVKVSAGSAHTVTITKASGSTNVYITIIICPWILNSATFEPLSLSFPQGSTFYTILEALVTDPSKSSSLGKSRALTGTANYSSTSGTGILSHSYTFEIVDSTGIAWTISGFGGCITHIAVDVR